jgi:hypothetical protein
MIFESMIISDGVNTIGVGEGTFLSSSFIKTDSSGSIVNWVVVELLGADRTFVLGDLCCTIGDPPLMYTFGTKSVPEPSTWALMLLGFAGVGFASYRSTRTTVAVVLRP